MATQYDIIFKRFLSQIKDYNIPLLDSAILVGDLKLLLANSLPLFFNCKQNLYDKDDDLEKFNITLTEEEINIIVLLMKKKWFEREIYNTDLTQQKFAEADFEFKSQANHLNALCNAMLTVVNKEIKKMISNYSRRTNGKYFNYSLLSGK